MNPICFCYYEINLVSEATHNSTDKNLKTYFGERTQNN